MILINTSNLKKEFGTRVLFDKVSFSIENNDKIGFVGANGTGKTTLFKMLTGEILPDSGEIFKSKETILGYMQQHAQMNTEKTLWAELMTVYKPLTDIENRLKSIESQIINGVGDLDKLTEEQSMLNERYENQGGFVYKNIAKASLLGLGFREEEFNMEFSSLSGGQQTRVILCKLLLGESNLLLLDEPTNHLDIESTEWLEEFLRDYKGAFVIISHDRYFLDRVTNKTFELENNKLNVYNGNYSTYVKLKEEREKTLIRNYENTTKEIHRIEGIIEQQKRWNREKNIKTAESKQKQIDRLEKDLEKPEIYNENINFNFTVKNTGGNEVLRCNNLKMGFDGKTLFENTDIEVDRGERVFLLGANGCGKTTLFKIITGEYEPVSGTTKLGANIQVGYFDQKQQNLSLEKDAIDEVWDTYPSMTQTEVRNAMAAFLFKNDDVFTPVSSLSGGERARIALIKLMLSGSNFLILDEPTNHLDIKSREALENALLGYNGTMLVISHDRYFINKLATKIYYMENCGVKKYDGDYTYFSQMKKEVNTLTADKPKDSSSKLDYKAKKQYEAEIRKLKNAIAKAEWEIEEKEQSVTVLEEQLMMPENATDFEKSMEITKNLEECKSKLEELYEAWELYSAQLAEKQNHM